MRSFDHNYVRDVIDRLDKLQPSSRPLWGEMTPEGLIGHLAASIRYSMGRAGTLPFRGNWVSRHIIGPLILSGILRIPKNIKTPAVFQPQAADSPCRDVDGLHVLLQEYLSLVQVGDLTPPPHPYFGDIGVDGWAKLHVAHFEHHLRQFQV